MSPLASKVPLFPNFLVPSLPLPLRRRRAGSPSRPKRTDAVIDNVPESVPSLSSSPISSDSDPASPSDAEAFPLDWVQPDGGIVPHGTICQPHPDTIRCRNCAADLAFGAQIVSKGFTGRYGRALLVSPPSSLSTTPVELGFDQRPHGRHKRDTEELDDDTLLNIKIGRKEPRVLVTGAHEVADISCAICGTKLGWKYVQASEASQKYKVGKYILETQRVTVFRPWEDVEFGHGIGVPAELGSRRQSSTSRTSVDSETNGQLTVVEASDEDDMVTFDSEDEDECEDIFAGTWNPAVAVKRRQTKLTWRKGQSR